MRKFVFKVLFFFAVIAIVDRAFGIAMKNVLQDTDKGDWGRNNYIFNDVNSDVIILGSSRAIHHYNPQVFSDSLGLSCYNCGEDGMGIFLMWARYQAIRKRYTPKLVIYEVFPEYDLLTNSDNQRYLKFLRPYNDLPVIKTVINDVCSNENMKLQSEMYRYNSFFLDIISQRISKPSPIARDYTYSPLPLQMKDNPRKMIERKMCYSFDSLKISYLEDLILACKKDSVMLVFTASPKFASFSDDEFYPLKKLCRTYNVPFINQYCNAVYRDNSAYFADVSHLNKKGAEMFTVLLVSNIKEMLSDEERNTSF